MSTLHKQTATGPNPSASSFMNCTSTPRGTKGACPPPKQTPPPPRNKSQRARKTLRPRSHIPLTPRKEPKPPPSQSKPQPKTPAHPTFSKPREPAAQTEASRPCEEGGRPLYLHANQRSARTPPSRSLGNPLHKQKQVTRARRGEDPYTSTRSYAERGPGATAPGPLSSMFEHGGIRVFPSPPTPSLTSVRAESASSRPAPPARSCSPPRGRPQP